MATSPKMTAICCHNALYGHFERDAKTRAGAPGVHTVEVPCSGRIEPIHLLKAFENGADGVVVIACPPQRCGTIEGSARLEKRIARTQALLAETGIDPGRLILIQADKPAAKNFKKIIDDAARAIEGLALSHVA